MSDIEILITKIGELVSCEIDEVASVEYTRGKDATFTIVMQDGKRYAVKIKTLT